MAPLEALEWAAFCGVLLSVWLYGFKGISGPVVGAISAAGLIAYGVLANIPVISLTNIGFVSLHIINAARILTAKGGTIAPDPAIWFKCGQDECQCAARPYH